MSPITDRLPASHRDSKSAPSPIRSTMTIIELAFLPLVEGEDVNKPESNAWKICQQMLSTVSQQNGFLNAYHGEQVEKPNVMQIMFEWETLEDHLNFMKSEAYGPFTDNVGKIMSGPLELMFHIQFESDFSKPATAPLTEVVAWYFPTSYDTKEWDAGFAKFDEALRANAEGFFGSAAGWSVDDVHHDSLKDVGGKGKAFVLAIGWQSLEAHMKYRETEAFQETIVALRGKSTGLDSRHVPFKV